MKYVVATIMIALTAAACGGDDVAPPGDSTTAPPPTATSTTTTTSTMTIPETTTTVPQAPPSVGDPQTDAFTTPGFPGTGMPALLQEVRTETYEPYTRIVFEFGDTAPDYRIEYIERPVVASPSGQPVDVAGTEHLAIAMAPAAGVDLSGDEPVVTYEGPDRISIDRGTITDMMKTEDFESHLTWVIGLDTRLAYSFGTLEEPSRLVVDIHGDATAAGPPITAAHDGTAMAEALESLSLLPVEYGVRVFAPPTVPPFVERIDASAADGSLVDGVLVEGGVSG